MGVGTGGRRGRCWNVRSSEQGPVAGLTIQILLSILTIFGAENRAKMTILGADFKQWPNLLH